MTGIPVRRVDEDAEERPCEDTEKRQSSSSQGKRPQKKTNLSTS